jgi:hypothetical protein
LTILAPSQKENVKNAKSLSVEKDKPKMSVSGGKSVFLGSKLFTGKGVMDFVEKYA